MGGATASSGAGHPGGRQDTQWPRWQVFKQDDPGKPHQAVGSVHAVDPEHALLMGRSVFARRPSAVSLWVAPDTAVFSATAEELAAGLPPEAAVPAAAAEFRVFRKRGHRRGMTFVEDVGTVTAAGPRAAMLEAVARFAAADAVAWWVVPGDALHASPESEAPAWFEPARDKGYKQQSAYGVVGAQAGRRGGRP